MLDQYPPINLMDMVVTCSRQASHMRRLQIATLILVAATLLSARCWAEAEGRPACSWFVSSPRPARPNDLGFEELDPRLKDPENPNFVPGPDSLLAYIQIDKLHHGHMYIQDRRTGAQREVTHGMLPRWAPNGALIACMVWKSPTCVSELRVIGARSNESLVPNLPCHAENYRWSPDSRSLAVTALLPHSDMEALYWVKIPSGRPVLLDTLTVFSEYEDLTWSPDSRALVVARVTSVEVEGEVTASDLWLFESEGQGCQLTSTPDYIESEPKWIDATHLVYARRKSTEPDLGNPERIVITLGRATPKPRRK